MEPIENLLLIDANEERRHQLETVLSFMGVQWQSGAEEDCLAFLSASPSLSGVVVGEVHSTNIHQLLDEYVSIPFISTDPLESDKSNLIGSLALPYNYESLTQLLHFCQSFRSLHPSLQNNRQIPTLQSYWLVKGRQFKVFVNSSNKLLAKMQMS